MAVARLDQSAAPGLFTLFMNNGARKRFKHMVVDFRLRRANIRRLTIPSVVVLVWLDEKYLHPTMDSRRKAALATSLSRCSNVGRNALAFYLSDIASTVRRRHKTAAKAARQALQIAHTEFTAHAGATPDRFSRKGRKFHVVMCR